MIRRLLILLWLAQLLGAALVAYGLVVLAHMGLPAALACGVAVVLLVRLGLALNNFRLAQRYASEPARFRSLGWIALGCLMAREFGATMLSSSWSMVAYRRIDRHFADSRCLPVLLVHGYGCNGGYWQSMSRALSRARISHRALDLEPMLTSIDNYGPAIAQALAALSREHGGSEVIVLAHSMGGLAVRACVQKHGGAEALRLAHLITLGTPHFGTGLANHGLGHNCRQMGGRPDVLSWWPCRWLRTLDGNDGSVLRGRLTSIYSLQDNIISPQESAYLPGAHNIALRGIGHVALALDETVQRAVIDTIVAVSEASAVSQESQDCAG